MWTPGQFFKQTSASSKRSSPAYNWNSKVLSLNSGAPHPSLASHNQRVQFKMLILVLKAINGLAPNYISNLVNILCPSKYLLRRNNEILLEPYKTLGDRAFAVAAPRLFNSLPREIRHVICLNTFKTKVKTFLFRTAFCSFYLI